MGSAPVATARLLPARTGLATTTANTTAASTAATPAIGRRSKTTRPGGQAGSPAWPHERVH